MNPLISIIVPVYQSENCLCRCIESIISQSYSNIELLLIDDGSIDGSLNLCKRYAEKDRRIRVYSKKHGGVSEARQKGMDYASGEYIIHCDSDDWMEREMLELMCVKAIEDNADIVVCDIVEELGKTVKYNLEFPNGSVVKDLISHQVKFTTYSLCNKLVRKDLIERHNIKFLSGIYFAEDMYFTTCVFSLTTNVSYISRPLYHYVRSTHSLTTSYSERSLESYKIVIDLLSNKMHGWLRQKVELNKCDYLLLACESSFFSIREIRSTYPEVHELILKYMVTQRAYVKLAIVLFGWRILFKIPAVISALVDCVQRKLLSMK